MSVVQLNCHLVGEFSPSALGLLESANNIVKRGRTPEVLLLETELFAPLEIVVRIQYSRDGLGSLLVRHSAFVLARVELGKVELAAGRFAGPETQIVHSGRSVARNGYVIRQSRDHLTVLPGDDLLAIVVCVFVHPAVELDIDRDIVSWEFPWVEVKPVVRDFDLIAVLNLLLEDTISISKTVAPSWIIQRSHAVEETCCKSAQTAIAQCGVVLLIDDILDAEAKILQALCCFVSLMESQELV